MDEQIYIIIAKVLSEEASAAEQQELSLWLASDVANQKNFGEMKSLWQKPEEVYHTTSFDVDAAWQKVLLATNIPQQSKKKTISFLPSWAKLSVAAAAIVIGFFAFQYFNDTRRNAFAANGNLELVLPDNSHIVLRQGSSLSYPSKFNTHERHVSLNGEAFFQVTHLEHRPFIIDAQSATVRVLGTSFDVVCNNNHATVNVTTGRVQMTAKNKSAVILTSGEQGNYKKGILSKQNVFSDSYLYWKTGILNFREQPFSIVIKELENINEANISFDASIAEDRRLQKLNISFHDEKIADMLTELCLITNCKWSLENNNYIIRSR